MSEEIHNKADHKQRNLLIATLLNFIISAVEIAGGMLSGSLALFSDALHNLGDAFAVLIAYVAGKIGARQPDHRMTFGFKRAEILAALLNAVILISDSFCGESSARPAVSASLTRLWIGGACSLFRATCNALRIFSIARCPKRRA